MTMMTVTVLKMGVAVRRKYVARVGIEVPAPFPPPRPLCTWPQDTVQLPPR